MKLHDNPNEFQELITLTAQEKHIPESAVERDYYIVRALLYLSQSEYASSCVFKGGTSLSKCYPGSIERFSEDIGQYRTKSMSYQARNKNIAPDRSRALDESLAACSY